MFCAPPGNPPAHVRDDKEGVVLPMRKVKGMNMASMRPKKPAMVRMTRKSAKSSPKRRAEVPLFMRGDN